MNRAFAGSVSSRMQLQPYNQTRFQTWNLLLSCTSFINESLPVICYILSRYMDTLPYNNNFIVSLLFRLDIHCVVS